MRRLCLRDTDFRNLWEDYALAIEARQHFAGISEQPAQEIASEYERIIAELEVEIAGFLGG